MASDLGSTPIDVEFIRNESSLYTGDTSPETRSIWYARYIDWVITTPMLLLTLLLGTGMPLGDIMITIFFDLVMIVTGLIGALVASQYKWGFYVRLKVSRKRCEVESDSCPRSSVALPW
jgi:bacteriorhodopsin